MRKFKYILVIIIIRDSQKLKMFNKKPSRVVNKRNPSSQIVTPLQQNLTQIQANYNSHKNSYSHHHKNNQESNLKQDELSQAQYEYGDDVENQTDKMSEIVSQLLSKNKINSKNAFEVPLLDVANLVSFKKQDEGSWRKMSQILENSSKVYAYRVDFMSQTISKMTSNMTRNLQQQQNQLHWQIPQIDEQIKNIENQQPGQSTDYLKHMKLDVHLDKVRLRQRQSQLSNFTRASPLSQSRLYRDSKIRRLMDQNGIAGLILATLPISGCLWLLLGQSHCCLTKTDTNINKYEIHNDQDKLALRHLFPYHSQKDPLNITNQISQLCLANEVYIQKQHSLSQCWQEDINGFSNKQTLQNQLYEHYELTIDDLLVGHVQSMEVCQYANNDNNSGQNNNVSTGTDFHEHGYIDSNVPLSNANTITYPNSLINHNLIDQKYQNWYNTEKPKPNTKQANPRKQHNKKDKNRSKSVAKASRQQKQDRNNLIFSAEVELQKQSIIKPAKNKQVNNRIIAQQAQLLQIQNQQSNNLFDHKLDSFHIQASSIFNHDALLENPVMPINARTAQESLNPLPYKNQIQPENYSTNIFQLESQHNGNKNEVLRSPQILQNISELHSILAGIGFSINFLQLYRTHKESISGSGSNQYRVKPETDKDIAQYFDGVSQAIDFLSVLHLCNELGLKLNQLDHFDFSILKS